MSFHQVFDLFVLNIGEYDAVIACVGAKADMFPELSGKLPLRTCRGIIACMQLPENIM